MTDEAQTEYIALLRAIAGENKQAFEALYRQTSPWLFAIALRILRRRSWAEEVLHDCFVNVWQHANQYNEQRSAPKTWLAQMVRYRAIDYLRLQQNQTQSLDDADEAALLDEADHFADASSSGQATRLQSCLQLLPSEQRQSLILAYYQGLTHSEIASHLQQPLGSVKSWVRRALAHLKECVGL